MPPEGLEAQSHRDRDPSALERAWQAFVVIQCWVLGAALAGIVVVSLVNVFMRYVLASSIVWADEVARLSFIVVSFVGAGLAVAYGAHLVIDTVVDRVNASRPMGRVWRWLIVAISISFFLVLIIGGLGQATRNFGQVSPALRISLGYLYLAVPAGAAVMLINYLGVLVFGPRALPTQAEEDLGSVLSDGREVV